MTFAVQPGKEGPWRSVATMLRQAHEESARLVDEAIAQRKAKNIPLDERADWRRDVEGILDSVSPSMDRDAVTSALEQALGIAGGGMKPLPPFKIEDELLGVEVRLRALSKADVLDMKGDLATAGADKAGYKRSAEQQRVLRPFVAASLVGIRGVDLEDGSLRADNLKPDAPEMARLLDDLDEAGLLDVVFACARAYQDMSPLRRRDFGSLRPLISVTSDAASVPSPVGVSLDARAVLDTSRETPIARPIDVPCVTSSTTTSVAGSSVPPSMLIVSSEPSPGSVASG